MDSIDKVVPFISTARSEGVSDIATCNEVQALLPVGTNQSDRDAFLNELYGGDKRIWDAANFHFLHDDHAILTFNERIHAYLAAKDKGDGDIRWFLRKEEIDVPLKTFQSRQWRHSELRRDLFTSLFRLALKPEPASRAGDISSQLAKVIDNAFDLYMTQRDSGEKYIHRPHDALTDGTLGRCSR